MNPPLTCTVTRRLLHPYLDGVLSDLERRDVEQHVAGCAGCRQAFVALERTALLVECLPRVAAPPALLARTMAAVRAEHRRARPTAWHPLASLVVVLAAVLGAATVVAASGEPLLATLEAALADPTEVFPTLASLAVEAQLSVVLGSSALLVAGAVALVHLMRGELSAAAAG